MTCKCPASCCPLIAKDGSPWTGEKGGECPEDENICPWWTIACSNGELHRIVEATDAGHPTPVLGPNKPKRYTVDPRKRGQWFDCPMAGECSWQKQALLHGKLLCPPREALKRGLDPRICLF